jgi:hypothetical protein
VGSLKIPNKPVTRGLEAGEPGTPLRRRRKTMRIIISIALLFITSQVLAAVSPMSAKLEKLRQSIESNPTVSAKKEYLQAFPHTCSTFRKTFYGADLDELYPTHEQHLALLQSLFKENPKKIISIWLGVATNCSWDADALGYLQHQLAGFGATDTKAFAAALLTKPAAEQKSIIRFIADVENHEAYEEYKVIQKNLKNLGFGKLEKEFAAAKKERMSKRDH